MINESRNSRLNEDVDSEVHRRETSENPPVRRKSATYAVCRTLNGYRTRSRANPDDAMGNIKCLAFIWLCARACVVCTEDCIRDGPISLDFIFAHWMLCAYVVIAIKIIRQIKWFPLFEVLCTLDNDVDCVKRCKHRKWKNCRRKLMRRDRDKSPPSSGCLNVHRMLE